ncbi:MAG TPA: tripartite tricarboxylate transporter substrate binding protein [Clostridia bacterium]|nr:tripartite tricarboxylate transporter substrate binding protein [Clostridia bacterium]
MKKIIALVLSLLLTMGLAACGNSASSSAASEKSSSSGSSWPSKPITLVVPWSAGGDTDFHARTLGQYLEKELGVSVTVVNTTGGGGSVASNAVKEAEPDGYTFLAFDSAIALNQASGITDFGYEAFEPVCLIGKSCGEFMVVRSDFPCNTVQELVDYTKEHPGEVIMAANTGATSYYAATKLQEAGAQFNIVNAGSSSERVASLIGKQIDVSVNAYGVIKQYIQTGELKVLGCLATERSDAYADISTAKEQGVDCAYDLIYNILAPKGTDPAVVAKLNEACQKVVENNSDYAAAIKDSYGELPFFMGTQQATSYLQQESNMYLAYADVFQKKS